jgi:hypothetical protein
MYWDTVMNNVLASRIIIHDQQEILMIRRSWDCKTYPWLLEFPWWWIDTIDTNPYIGASRELTEEIWLVLPISFLATIPSKWWRGDLLYTYYFMSIVDNVRNLAMKLCPIETSGYSYINIFTPPPKDITPSSRVWKILINNILRL